MTFVLVAFAAPGAATTATVKIEDDQILYVAAPGEVNHVTLEAGAPGKLVFTDTGATISASDGCVSTIPSQAVCDDPDFIVSFFARDGDDRVTVLAPCNAQSPCTRLVYFADGPGDDVYVGGEGDDEFDAGSRPNGSDVFLGGGGTDDAYYGKRTARVYVRLDGRANDGVRGERDNIRLRVETVLGSKGGTTFVGNRFSNEFNSNSLRAADVAFGRGGSDTLVGGPGNDELHGGAGADFLFGVGGSNELRGGAGRDQLAAGASSDRYYAKDGWRDRIIDGGGKGDSAVVDGRLDVLRGRIEFLSF